MSKDQPSRNAARTGGVPVQLSHASTSGRPARPAADASGLNDATRTRLYAFLIAVAGLLVLGIICFFGLRALFAPPDPRPNALKFLAGVRAMDQSQSEAYSVPGPNASKLLENQRKIAEAVPQLGPIVKDVVSKLDYKVGVPTIDGEKAVVPVTLSLPGGGAPQSAGLNMVLTKGVWKVSDDNLRFGRAMMDTLSTAMSNTDAVKDVLRAIAEGKLKLDLGDFSGH